MVLLQPKYDLFIHSSDTKLKRKLISGALYIDDSNAYNYNVKRII